MDGNPGPAETGQTRFEQRCLLSGEGLQIISATDELFNHVDTNDYLWSGQGPRALELAVRFQRPFATPPLVSLGLSGIDSSHSENLRFNITAESVSEAGFVIRFVTWDDTRIARASISWTAIGKEPVVRKPPPARPVTARKV